MQPGDHQKRMDFARAYLALSDQEKANIAFSDEAGFQMGGHVDSQNVRRFVSYYFIGWGDHVNVNILRLLNILKDEDEKY